uniref:Uncharacterized protein n=1 Tax=Ascaris lumbricoides TaxID=6252 RepID=A0A0M3HF12_ASCLU
MDSTNHLRGNMPLFSDLGLNSLLVKRPSHLRLSSI